MHIKMLILSINHGKLNRLANTKVHLILKLQKNCLKTELHGAGIRTGIEKMKVNDGPF